MYIYIYIDICIYDYIDIHTTQHYKGGRVKGDGGTARRPAKGAPYTTPHLNRRGNEEEPTPPPERVFVCVCGGTPHTTPHHITRKGVGGHHTTSTGRYTKSQLQGAHPGGRGVG